MNLNEAELLEEAISRSRAAWKTLRRRVALSHISEEVLTSVLIGRAKLLLPEGAQIIHVKEDFLTRALLIMWVHKDNRLVDEGSEAPFKHLEVEHVKADNPS